MVAILLVCGEQCDQIGDFWKILATISVAKVAQIDGHFWGDFDKTNVVRIGQNKDNLGYSHWRGEWLKIKN